ncbi:MAG TPA: RNA polymerase sigma factor [Rhizomicrobium sp.]|jgi:RNA polymerase sigma-70 factor (ECF subfamily)
MSDKTDSTQGAQGWREQAAVMAAADLEGWFVREVLPLEAALMQFLRRSWHNKAEIDDLRQEVYVRVCEAARKEIPHPAKPFVFAVARNLLVDRVRREHVVSIETMSDLDTLGIAVEEPGPDRNAIAHQELRRLQGALDQLPQRCREAVLLRKIEGLSYREIAQRMGISEDTVSEHLSKGMYALADTLYGDTLGGKT